MVEIGALGALDGISKIAASVIAPLANQNVSIFCLSTNQDDYVLVRSVIDYIDYVLWERGLGISFCRAEAI